MTIKILVFDYRPTEAQFFENNEMLSNFDISFFETSLNEETIKNIPQDVKDSTNVISVFVDSFVGENIINQFKNLRIISTRSTGIDHINEKVCHEKNIAIINVSNYGSTTVAQHIAGMMLALVRKLIPASQYLKEKGECHELKSGDFIGHDLSALTFGAVGTGAIGAAVCRIAHAFGMKILAYDVRQMKELEDTCGVKYVPFDELLKEADVISLHIPYTGENKNMFGKKEFEMMKNGSYFINSARGELVSVPDLYEVVQSQKLGGVALDVTTCEEVTFKCVKLMQDLGDVPFECARDIDLVKKMLEFENVIITPHIAYQTVESVNYILSQTFNGIMDCIKGGNDYRTL